MRTKLCIDGVSQFQLVNAKRCIIFTSIKQGLCGFLVNGMLFVGSDFT